jgi:RNA recognition motif-containing protein
MKTIRVGNVPLSVGEKELRELFETAGAPPETLALGIDGDTTQTATISFSDETAVRKAKKLHRARVGQEGQLKIEIDDQFDGITVLYNGATAGDTQNIE